MSFEIDARPFTYRCPSGGTSRLLIDLQRDFVEPGDFGAYLERLGISHLVVLGVTTEVCVQRTRRDANDRGYECLLVEEATESYFPEFKRATLEMVRAKGVIVGWTTALADVLRAFASSPVSPVTRSSP